MTQEIRQREREFHTLLEWVVNLPRPKRDYTQEPASAFLRLEFYHRLTTLQVCYMILLRTFAVELAHGWIAEPVLRKGGLSLQEIIAWRNRLTRRVLREAYQTYPHPVLIGFLADLELEMEFLEDEVARRFEKLPVTRALIRLDPEWTETNANAAAAVRDAVRLLGLDRPRIRLQGPGIRRVVSKVRPRRESPEDVDQSAFVKLFEEWRRPGDIVENIGPKPGYPIPAEQMLPAEREFWDGLMGRVWEIGGQAILNEQVPILSGEREAIGRRVRTRVFNEWDTVERQRKMRDERRGTIFHALHSQPTPADEILVSKEDLEPILKQADRAYRIAKKRWGALGQRFVYALRDGKTVTEASQYAGISRQTGQKYLRDLKRDLS